MKLQFVLLVLLIELSISAKEIGVMINGVCWAPYNVSTPGKFAKSHGNACFYNWNSKTPISNFDSIKEFTIFNKQGIIKYNIPNLKQRSIPWEKRNDPSPKGWRIPTSSEILSLLDTTKVQSIWLSKDSVCGRLFTDKNNGNSIFLPACGFRDVESGLFYEENSLGGYWVHLDKNNSIFLFGCCNGHLIDGFDTYIFSIRSVRTD